MMSTYTTCLYVQVSAYLRVVKHFRCQRSWMQIVAAFFIFQPAEFNHKRRSLPKSLEIAICLAMLPRKSGSGRSNLYIRCSLMGSDSTYPFPSKRNRNKIQYIQSNHTQIKVPAAKVLFDPREIRHCTQEILRSINRLRRKTSEKYSLSREWPWPFDHCSVAPWYCAATSATHWMQRKAATWANGAHEHLVATLPQHHSDWFASLAEGLQVWSKKSTCGSGACTIMQDSFTPSLHCQPWTCGTQNNKKYTQQYCHLLHPETCTSSGIS